MSTQVPVTVPADSSYATEPAISIANIHAIVSATSALVAACGIGIAQELPDAVNEWVTAAFPVALIIFNWWWARHQGQATRAAVFSPATVQELVAEAEAKGQQGVSPPMKLTIPADTKTVTIGGTAAVPTGTFTATNTTTTSPVPPATPAVANATTPVTTDVATP